MDYLFSGQISKVLNGNYLKLGSRAFFINHEYLIVHGTKRQQRLNMAYYYAYLDCLVYVTYKHLFGLDMKIRHAGFPLYWYNSVTAVCWMKFDQKMTELGINPVEYLSSCFSSFYYQFVKYHRVYNYRVSQLTESVLLSKYHQHVQASSIYFHYYFSGNPILDLAERFFNFRFITDKPIKSLVKEIRYDWLSYLCESKRLLRMPKLQFKMYFRHSVTPLENHLIQSGDWLDIIKLIGVPDDAQAFGFISARLWAYTEGYTKHLLGLENYFLNSLAIKPYKLYSINVARRELNILQQFSKLR